MFFRSCELEAQRDCHHRLAEICMRKNLAGIHRWEYWMVETTSEIPGSMSDEKNTSQRDGRFIEKSKPLPATPKVSKRSSIPVGIVSQFFIPDFYKHVMPSASGKVSR